MSLEQQLGQNVRDLRTGRGWSQNDLAKEVGLTRSSIANLEAGRQNISLAILESLATAFRVPAGHLLSDAGPGDPYGDGYQAGWADCARRVRDAVNTPEIGRGEVTR